MSIDRIKELRAQSDDALDLTGLEPGEWRELTREEVEALRKLGRHR